MCVCLCVAVRVFLAFVVSDVQLGVARGRHLLHFGPFVASKRGRRGAHHQDTPRQQVRLGGNGRRVSHTCQQSARQHARQVALLQPHRQPDEVQRRLLRCAQAPQAHLRQPHRVLSNRRAQRAQGLSH